MHKQLAEIIYQTKQDLKKVKQSNHQFIKAIKKSKKGSVAIMAEIKLASPNEGDLGSEKEIESIVRQYEKAGVAAISVVTEKHFFKGDLSFLRRIKQAVFLPVLQKDFIVDQYQLYEAKIAKADAILLIAKILSKEQLIYFVELAQKLGLTTVVEINNHQDLKKALATKTKIIAVNSRNLNTFAVDINKACKILKMIPDKFIKLGFSGILGKEEVIKYQKAGADGVLIGTSLMKTRNIEKYIKSLQSTKVKICGIRSLEAALVAINTGADFLGFNFVLGSKRYIEPENAAKIINQIKGRIKIVGVFQNEDQERIKKLTTQLQLDFVQLHDNNNSAIKTITPGEYLLLDRVKQGAGKMVDLGKAKKLARKYLIFLAGGLTPDNVAGIIKKVQPFGVDVAGGVETDGVQDVNKIKVFINNAKGVSL